MQFKSIVEKVGVIALLAGVLILGSKLNSALGYRRGEVDRGRWYVMETLGGGGTYLEKGIDPGNMFFDADRASDMFEKLPNYLATKKGFGAVYIDIGWLADGYLRSSGWQLFSTEAQAVKFLKDNGVARDRISLLYE